MKISKEKRLFRGDSGWKSPTTPAIVRIKRFSISDWAIEPVNQSKPDRPYLACSGCCGSHMPSGWSAWSCCWLLRSLRCSCQVVWCSIYGSCGLFGSWSRQYRCWQGDQGSLNAPVRFRSVSGSMTDKRQLSIRGLLFICLRVRGVSSRDTNAKTHKVGHVIWSSLGERNWNGRMGTQLSLSRFLPVKVKTSGISGRMRRQLLGIVNWNPW